MAKKKPTRKKRTRKKATKNIVGKWPSDYDLWKSHVRHYHWVQYFVRQGWPKGNAFRAADSIVACTPLDREVPKVGGHPVRDLPPWMISSIFKLRRSKTPRYKIISQLISEANKKSGLSGDKKTAAIKYPRRTLQEVLNLLWPLLRRKKASNENQATEQGGLSEYWRPVVDKKQKAAKRRSKKSSLSPFPDLAPVNNVRSVLLITGGEKRKNY